MAIQDPDPERRNLTVTSIAFIAYFYAGGSFPDASVRLQVVNANFSRPMVLGVIAWVALIWFIYRYWQSHNGKYSIEFDKEFSRWQHMEYIETCVSKSIGKRIVADSEEGYHVIGLRWQGWCVNADIMYASNLKRNREGKFASCAGKKEEDTIKLTNITGWFIALRATTECIIKYPSFSNYIVPYILAFLAVAGAVVRNVF